MKKVVSIVIALIFATFLLMGAGKPKEADDTRVLSENSTLSLFGEVNGQSVGEVITAARALKTKGCSKGIDLFLNTPGGQIQSGLELNEALKGLGCPVNTITLFAASMGFQIAQNLGERMILDSGILMSHRARGQISGEFGGVSPSQMESRYAIWKNRIQEMDQTTVNRTNGKQTLASYQAAYVPELWVTGKQAVDQGYADRVVKVRCDETLDGVTTHDVEFMGMSVKYDMDKCPINTSPSNIRMNIETNQGVMSSDDFIKKGGQFGSACLMTSGKLCSLDTTINLVKIESLKQEFINHFVQAQSNVIYMTFR